MAVDDAYDRLGRRDANRFPGRCRALSIAIVFLAHWATVLSRLFADEPNDLPLNVPLPTLGGQQFWSDELFFHQWHIQRNTLTGYYRLLDEHDVRRAWGTLTECRNALEQIKKSQHIPPMHGRAVILVHGLCGSHTTMESLNRYLRDTGGYTTFNITYPTTQCNVSEHAQSLARIIANLDGIEEINFVAHSLGNIVVRNYLANQSHKTDPRLRRMVMLGPPNHGSLAAVVLAENALFKTVTGQVGQELGVQWAALEQQLATPTFEFGVIAGGKQDAHGFNPILPGDNDSIVSVETTQLAGASDFVILPVIHPLLPDSKRVQECTLHYLQHGCFIVPDKRHPLSK
jgi:pimeloyl-ACP methyl ester carboxylesterase